MTLTDVFMRLTPDDRATAEGMHEGFVERLDQALAENDNRAAGQLLGVLAQRVSPAGRAGLVRLRREIEGNG